MQEAEDPRKPPDVDTELPVEAELIDGDPAARRRDANRIIADTLVGPNLRWKDNLFQAVAILGCLVIGALIGWFVWWDPGAAIAGALGGLIVGTIASGAFLMVFRAVRHFRGDHR